MIEWYVSVDGARDVYVLRGTLPIRAEADVGPVDAVSASLGGYVRAVAETQRVVCRQLQDHFYGPIRAILAELQANVQDLELPGSEIEAQFESLYALLTVKEDDDAESEEAEVQQQDD
jgi:hypothetical protein